MVELRNGKQADQAGIHQPAQAHHANVEAHVNAKRKDSLAYEHSNHPVSHVDAGDDLPRILEEIGEEERKQEQEQKEKLQNESWPIEHGFDDDFEHHQQHGQLSLPQDYHENIQSIPQKRAHSDISLLNFDDDDVVRALDGEKKEQLETLDEIDEWEEQKLEDMLKEHESNEGEKQGELIAKTATGSDVEVPIQPPDRRPTPGRINNPRAVNEEGAAPVYSKGVVEEFPWKTDPNYSRRTYLDMDEHGLFSESADAPEGPPKKKGRYNNPERLKWEEEQPYVNPDSFSHATHLCASRGPNGPPTYDSAGYLLDYEKCSKVTQPSGVPRPSRKSWKAEEKRMEHDEQEALEMTQLFFEPGAAPAKEDIQSAVIDHWRDRVSKDLGVPWHAIGLEQFREWDQKGFAKAKEGEYRDFDQVEKERMMELHSGSYFRPG
ncbi:uncharacterized protein J3D65DRAFT_388806 [Phyllosticta citribraziliensis]|uniref:Uncharacterized protein n=1 Tax=Phyllosticta citribraziliensis TaxID=989973 RepID=A0ABR1LP36_9PEZI